MLLNHWDAATGEWVPVSAAVDESMYVPAEGGAITGPLGLTTQTTEAYDLTVVGTVEASRITTTRGGRLNMAVSLEDGMRSADFGGAQIGNIGSAADGYDMVNHGDVDAAVRDWEVHNIVLKSGWEPAQDFGGNPVMRRSPDGFITISGDIRAVQQMQPNSTAASICDIPVGWRPAFRYVFATFTSILSYARVDANPTDLRYTEGAVLPAGTVISLGCVEYFPAIGTVQRADAAGGAGG